MSVDLPDPGGPDIHAEEPWKHPSSTANNRLRGKTLDNIGRVVFAIEGFVSDMTYDPDSPHWWRVNFQWRIAVSGMLLALLKLPASGGILAKQSGREWSTGRAGSSPVPRPSHAPGCLR